MKRKFLLFTAFAGIASIALSSYSNGPAAGGAGNVSAAGCNNGGGCHGAASSNTTVTLVLLDNNVPTTVYTPGKQYVVAVGGSNSASLAKFGFQVSCVKVSSATTQAGTLAVGTTANVAVRTTVTPNVIEHTTALNGVTAGNYLAQFKWTAPAAGTGAVKFQIGLNAVNGNGASSGDQWATSTATITEGNTGVGTIANNLSLTAFPNPATTSLQVKVNGTKAGNYMVAVYDLTGRMLQQQAMTAQEATVNISSLAAGHYVAVVTGEAGRGVMSFSKQ